jgi:hypothetical protein|tara:strand:- start:167 stop:652 length:486 start_codon:yes stop_codon:yes gene_type:complete
MKGVLSCLLQRFIKIKKSMTEKESTANLLLIRDTFTSKSVMGKLYCNGEFIAHTLELPWKDNQKSVSCIPEGRYRCRVRLARESATRNYVHLLVQDVENRSYILFHYGNYPSDSRGCILTGTHRAQTPDKIFESKIAHTYMMNYIIENQLSENINLVIKNR